ncbi:MAG: putative endonuclease [Solirubrobacteraceae bacterium]|nr:putative endonuclease [Solirubrobacteraceae bacterium]
MMATMTGEPHIGAWVYLLWCRSDDSLYTGWTNDLERRLGAHRAGTASRYTRSRLPVELALALPMADASAARREEARIKRLTRPEKLALIAAAPGLVPSDAAPAAPSSR